MHKRAETINYRSRKAKATITKIIINSNKVSKFAMQIWKELNVISINKNAILNLETPD